jgi:hypothetical protein
LWKKWKILKKLALQFTAVNNSNSLHVNLQFFDRQFLAFFATIFLYLNLPLYIMPTHLVLLFRVAEWKISAEIFRNEKKWKI